MLPGVPKTAPPPARSSSPSSAPEPLPPNSPSPLLLQLLPLTILVDAIAAPFLSDSDIVRLAATCRTLAWLAPKDRRDVDRRRTSNPHNQSRLARRNEPRSPRSSPPPPPPPPAETFLAIPWRRRCQPPFARVPAGNVLGGDASLATWARLSHVLSVLPSFGPSKSLPSTGELASRPSAQPPAARMRSSGSSDDNQRAESVCRYLRRAPVLTILRGFSVLPRYRLRFGHDAAGDVENDVDRGRTFEAWFRCDGHGLDDALTVASYSGGVIMGFHVCDDRQGFSTADFSPYLGRCGNAYFDSDLTLLAVHPATGLVFSTPPVGDFRARKLTGGPRVTDGRWHHAALRLAQNAKSKCCATLFVDGVQVGTSFAATTPHRGSVTVGSGVYFDEFGFLPETVTKRPIALPFRGKIVAARVWGRAVQDVGALLEMKAPGGAGHVVLDGSAVGEALLRRVADLRRGRGVDWTMREELDYRQRFGLDDGVVSYFPILSEFCERV